MQRFTPLDNGVRVEELNADNVVTATVELTREQAANLLVGNVYHRGQDEWLDEWLDGLGTKP